MPSNSAFQDFISHLMDLDVNSRYSCREALAHPWIADGAAADINIANSVATQMRKHFIKKKWRQAYNATAVIRKMRLLALASTAQSQDIGSPGTSISGSNKVYNINP